MALNFLNNGYFAGKVGIGTESPTATLHVESADDALLRLKSTDNKAYIALSDNDTNGYISSENSKLSLGANTGVNANNLNIDLSNNNVGIGTASPSNRLEIVGPYQATPLKVLRHADYGNVINIGRNGISETANIGYPADATMNFSTNGSERVRITSTGNVGIGDTPSFKLDVNVTSNRARFKATTGNADIELSSIAGHDWLIRSLSDDSFAIYDEDAVSERMRIDSSGNVGIGTTNPFNKIHVNTNVDGDGLLLDYTANNNKYVGVFFKIDTNTSDAYKKGALVWERTGGYNEGRFHFLLNNDDNASNVDLTDSKVTILSTGNVGIGTTSPSGLLHVSSGTSGDAVVIIESDTDNDNENDNPQLQFKQDGGNTIAKIGLSGDAGTIFTNSLANTAYFGNDEAASVHTNATARLTIESGGDVGIGTTNPGYKLDVNGSVNTAFGATNGYRINTNRVLSQVSGGVEIGVLDYKTIYPNISFNNDNTFKVQQNGSTRIIVNSSGNVGIGTTSPRTKLEIGGSGSLGAVTNKVISATFDGGYSTTNSLQYNVNAFIGTSIGSTTDIFSSTGSETDKNFYTGLISDNSYFNGSRYSIVQGGAERLTIARGGNVGIGTTSPAALLHLQSTGSPSIRIQDSDGTNQYATINHNNGDNQYIARNNTANGSHVFYGQTGVSSFNERMRITSAGNVGIGTTSPTDKLDVNGRTTSKAFRTYTTNTDYNLLSRSSGGNAALYVQSATSDTNQAIAQFNYGSATANAGQKVLLVAKDNSYFLNTNVGIGTTSPGYKLEVAGNARVSSNFYIGNVDAVTTATEVLVRQSDRVRGITPANLINASGGPYLPLTGSVYDGGTATWSNGITGNLALVSTSGTKGIIIGDEDNGSGQLFVQFNSSNGGGILNNNGGNLEITAQNYGNGSDIIFRGNDTNNNLVTYFQTVGASQKVRVVDNIKLTIGTSDDLQIYNDGVSSNIIDSFNMSQMLFRQHFLNGDMTFQSDDGTGGVTTYFKLDGGNERLQVDAPNGMLFSDNIIAKFGTSADLQIKHNGTDSYIENYTGNLNVVNYADNKDIIFWSDNGAGGITTYFELDGAAGYNKAHKDILYLDNIKARFGNSNDLQIYHDGSNSYIKETGTGSLYVGTNSFRLTNAAGTENLVSAFENDTVILYNNNIEKLRTTGPGVTVTGIASATTFSGDLNGTINTATTGVTQVNSVDNTTIATTAYVNNKIALIPAGLRISRYMER